MANNSSINGVEKAGRRREKLEERGTGGRYDEEEDTEDEREGIKRRDASG